MFDEQPDGDPHGECAADIHRLTEENKTLRDTLRGIAESDWRKWDEEVRSPYEFVKWAKSRAQHTLVAIGADSEDELRQMEVAMRLLPAPEEDKAVSINAIHALLTTMTPNA